MNTVRGRGATALTAAIALALGGIPAAFTTSSILAAGEGPTTLAPASASVGKLTLSTDSSQGTVSLNGITETFTGGQQCKIEWANEPTLLDLTGSQTDGDPAVAGFRDGDIGVYEPGPDGSPTNASQCFRVDGDSFDLTEVLNVSLGSNPALVEQLGNTESPILIGGVKITYAVTSKSGNFTVKGNDGAVNLGTVAWPATKQQKVSPGDVLSATIALPANTLISSFSLTPDTGTSFSLRTAELDLYSQRDATFCNPGNPAGGTSSYTEGTTTVRYLGNADESNSCFGINLTSGDQEYQFLYPLDVSTDAQFVFDQTWTFPASEFDTPDYTLRKAYVDFELVATAVPREMLWCPAEVYTDGTLQLITDETTLDWLADNKDMELTEPGTQFACIDRGSRETSFEQDSLKVKDKIFLIGDAKFSSP